MPSRERFLPPGTIVGRYRIERPAGSGAMAAVYSAHDTILDRTVALKVLPESSASDPVRLRRFLREAQLASSLNHPAIVTVFDSGAAGLSDGRTVTFLAMEWVEGSMLRDWARNARDIPRLIRVLAAVADGLARAHESGIVHCDLKPENLMVARGDLPKVVDFGIAKLTERSSDPPRESDTAPAAPIGTAAYMAPEQVSGAAIDARADIFAFGCVMYELLAGQSPFLRDSPVETMHAILHETPPPLLSRRPDLPSELEHIARRCLERNRDERYQSIKDVALDLRDAAPRSGSVGLQRRAKGLRYAAAAASIAVLLLVILWTFARRDRIPNQALASPPPAASQPLMVRMTNSGNIGSGAISPDGNVLAYVTQDGATESLWVRQVATGTSVRVVPPEEVYYTDLSISRDGNYIYYGISARSEPNVSDLIQVPLFGGERRRIVHDYDQWFDLAPDGKHVAFRRFSALDRVARLLVADIDSGEEQTILTRRFPNFVGPIGWRPDGRRITFVDNNLGDSKLKNALYEINVATRVIARIPTPDWAWLGPFAWLPDASGVLVTAAEREQAPQIWLLDPATGHGRRITSDISEYDSVTITADSRSFVSKRSDLSANIWVTSLQHPREARAATTGLGNRFGAGGVRWMPDGSIAFTNTGAGRVPTLFTVSPLGGQPRQLTRGMPVWNPALSPDGKRLAFISNKSGLFEVWTSAIDGSDARQVTHCGAATWPSWMRDGRSLVYVSMGAEQAAWRVGIDGSKPVRLTDRPANFPRVSPDGKWLLCRLRSVDGKPPLWRTALIPLDHQAPPRFVTVSRTEAFPRSEWLPGSDGFVFVDFANGVGNLWLQSLDGREPRQLTNFDSGVIANFDIDAKGRIALVRVELVNDLVLVRDFR